MKTLTLRPAWDGSGSGSGSTPCTNTATYEHNSVALGSARKIHAPLNSISLHFTSLEAHGVLFVLDHLAHALGVHAVLAHYGRVRFHVFIAITVCSSLLQ